MSQIVEVDITLETDAWERHLKHCDAFSQKVLETVFRKLPDIVKEPVEVAILLADDEALQELNKSWRGKDRPTNVLSFPAPKDLRPYPGQPLFLGDLALSFSTLEREAREQSKTFEQHAAHLLIHGTLHLLGFDHETEEEAKIMEELEVQILADMGIPDPYNEEDRESD